MFSRVSRKCLSPWIMNGVSRTSTDAQRNWIISAEILGKNIWELLPKLVATEFQYKFQRVMSQRVPAHFEFLAPRGGWFDVQAYPSNDGLSAYILDISQRKKNEEELSRLAAIVDASEDAILSLALDGTVLTWNGGAERIYGYSAQEMIGHNIGVVRLP